MPNVIFRPPPPPTLGENFASSFAGGVAQGVQENSRQSIANKLMLRQAALDERLKQIQADRDLQGQRTLMGERFKGEEGLAKGRDERSLANARALEDYKQTASEKSDRRFIEGLAGPMPPPVFGDDANLISPDDRPEDRTARGMEHLRKFGGTLPGGGTIKGATDVTPTETAFQKGLAELQSNPAYIDHLTTNPGDIPGAVRAAMDYNVKLKQAGSMVGLPVAQAKETRMGETSVANRKAALRKRLTDIGTAIGVDWPGIDLDKTKVAKAEREAIQKELATLEAGGAAPSAYVPQDGDMENPQTGEVIRLVNGAWVRVK